MQMKDEEENDEEPKLSGGGKERRRELIGGRWRRWISLAEGRTRKEAGRGRL